MGQILGGPGDTGHPGCSAASDRLQGDLSRLMHTTKAKRPKAVGITTQQGECLACIRSEVGMLLQAQARASTLKLCPSGSRAHQSTACLKKAYSSSPPGLLGSTGPSANSSSTLHSAEWLSMPSMWQQKGEQSPIKHRSASKAFCCIMSEGISEDAIQMGFPP